MRSDGFLLSGRFFIPMGPEHQANMARTLSPWEYTKPTGREGRAWGPPLQRQGRTVGEQCVLPVLRGSGPINRTGFFDPNGVGVCQRQTRPSRPEGNTFKARCPASGFLYHDMLYYTRCCLYGRRSNLAPEMGWSPMTKYDFFTFLVILFVIIVAIRA